MVRIIDGILQNPILIIGSWMVAAIVIVLLFKFNTEFDNEELAEFASLGAILFVVQSLLIPLKFLPVFFQLSGVPFVILVKGVNKGLIISSSAIILNHIFIPGAFSMLGLNLTNMLLAGLVAGMVPSWFYKRLGRRIRYLTGLVAGLVYYLIISILVSVEFYFSSFDFPLSEFFLFLLIAVFIMGLIEGFLTAIGSSYYYRSKGLKTTDSEFEADIEKEQDEPLEKITFFDEVPEEEDE